MSYDDFGFENTLYNTKLFNLLVKHKDSDYDVLSILHDVEECAIEGETKKYGIDSNEAAALLPHFQGGFDHIDVVTDGADIGVYVYDRGNELGGWMCDGSAAIKPVSALPISIEEYSEMYLYIVQGTLEVYYAEHE